MKQINKWIQCLSCGREFSVDASELLARNIRCFGCNSREYIPLELDDVSIGDTIIKLNESLLKDGEWN